MFGAAPDLSMVTQRGGCRAGSRGDLPDGHCKVSGGSSGSSFDDMPLLFARENGVSMSFCSIEKQNRIQELFKK